MSSEIRHQARARRAALGLPPEDALPAQSVVEACLHATGLERQFLGPDDDLLAGASAVLNHEMSAVYQDGSRPFAMQAFDAVHEFAHFWLHAEAVTCTAEDLDLSQTAEAASGAMSKVEGYAPKQKRENEANVYAAEMLLPGPLARRLFWEEGQPAGAIAEALGLPSGMVQMQLADALLLPHSGGVPEAEPTPASADVTLDGFQQAAAQIPCGPLLLGAGPGTGKTKTLVGRCQFLTQQQGVPATQILALTFSRKAAGEMKERLIAAGVGSEKAGPWVGTFHSFGLEVLRRYGDKIGLTGDIKLLDTLDGVTLLENNLAELRLDALDNLYNPAIHLGGILGQIGRAKDELCPPERYAELCAAMQAPADAAMGALEAQVQAAGSDKGLKGKLEDAAKRQAQAAKAAEVAHCYAVYERLLAQNGFLDFGGLISRTVELLESHPDVLAALQAEYPHVLADEYQDVNRACARLVRLLAGDAATGLWAVGDHRQSIYQFQGASPANVAAFERDYPNGRRLELGVNYRSRAPIVDLFGAAMAPPAHPNNTPRIGGFIGVGGGGLWRAHRGTHENAPYPAVTNAVSPDDVGQAEGIAQAIKDLKAVGWDHRQQAILCRSHAQAEVLAGLLTARDIPILYLGALLERPEIKDLLCLLALFADPDGSALVRVAAFPEYAVPQADTLAFLTQMRRAETPLLEALSEADLHPGLAKLAAHLAELETMENDPAALLRHYLFGLSYYLRHLTTSEPRELVRLGRTLAIHQLLGMAADAGKRLVAPRTLHGPPNSVRAFLAHLRRLQASGSALRAGACRPEAEALDAVRLLTAHAAKGLEYPVVFLPNLGAGQFPTRGRSDGIPTPPGLADAAGRGTGRGALPVLRGPVPRPRPHHPVSGREERGGQGRRALAAAGLNSATLAGARHRGNGLAGGPPARARSGGPTNAGARGAAGILVVGSGNLPALPAPVPLRAEPEAARRIRRGWLPTVPRLRAPDTALAGGCPRIGAPAHGGGGRSAVGGGLGGTRSGRTSARGEVQRKRAGDAARGRGFGSRDGAAGGDQIAAGHTSELPHPCAARRHPPGHRRRDFNRRPPPHRSAR